MNQIKDLFFCMLLGGGFLPLLFSPSSSKNPSFMIMEEEVFIAFKKWVPGV